MVAQCQEPGASVSRISLDNGFNTNMVRRWISEARRANKAPSKTPGFVPVNMAAVLSVPGNQSLPDKRSTIRIDEIWLATEPLDMRAGPTRPWPGLFRSLVQPGPTASTCLPANEAIG
ncbi:hypothetical protein [Marinobacter salarius]|uniref:hypothetical protein n=1 Tax=Marinobacter salarius TaxID=1420917 RepID=UPI0032EF6C25